MRPTFLSALVLTFFSSSLLAQTPLQNEIRKIVVDAYIKSLGVARFHLEDGEHGLHRDPTAQYRNWFEPAGAVQFLRKLSDNSPLSPEHTELLLTWMKDSPTGPNRLKGALFAGF